MAANCRIKVIVYARALIRASTYFRSDWVIAVIISLISRLPSGLKLYVNECYVLYVYIFKLKSVSVCVNADGRYQEWLEKNKVQHMHSDSEDEMQQTSNRQKRFRKQLGLHTCAPRIQSSKAVFSYSQPRMGPGHPSFPLSIYFMFSPFLLFPFFHWLYLFSSFVHPFPFYQNSPTPFPGRRS